MGIIKFIIVLIFFVSVLVSCEKYLDAKPDNTLSTPETLEDLQAVLDYSKIMNEKSSPVFPEVSADDYFVLQSTFDGISEVDQYAYIWEPGLKIYFNSNDWRTCYLSIYNTNVCLDAIVSIPRTGQNFSSWDNVYGSSLFFRAYNYLNLCWTYAQAYDNFTADTDLGIAVRLNSDFNIPSVRSSLRQSYAQVIADAKESIVYLPKIPAHLFRPSKLAAYGLLARAYLSMGEYGMALKYADSTLRLKEALMDFNGDADIINNFADVISPFRRFNKEVIFETTMATQNFSIIAPSRASIDTSLYSLFDNNDLRRVAYFFQSAGYAAFKGSYTGSTSFFSGLATNEMYLIRAECYARTGHRDLALNDLNKLLIKRYRTGFFIPVTANSDEEALNKIILERRKELVMRGVRWPDIKRLNKENANIVPRRYISGNSYELLPNSYKYALPLPGHVIDYTGMQQNPGW